MAIQAGDRVGLIGRNGTGKSSLLSALLGKIPLDAGEVQRRPGLVHRERRAGAGAAARRNSARVAGAARRFREHARRPRAVGARSAAQRIPAAVLGESRCIAGFGFRWRAQARRAGTGVRDDARPDAARRADQPPRRRRHRDAGRSAAAECHLHRHHARPALPRQGGELHRRARSRRPAHLPGQLLGVRGAQGRDQHRRRPRAPALREILGAGRGVDPQGRRGAAHAQRRPREAPRASARRARGQARAHRADQAHRGYRRALRQAGGRARERRQEFRRPARFSTTSRCA